ncbi:hypothetical protein PLA106_16539, partial [Pseudomonas amygdali pv. lachrymans str. M302278]
LPQEAVTTWLHGFAGAGWHDYFKDRRPIVIRRRYKPASIGGFVLSTGVALHFRYGSVRAGLVIDTRFPQSGKINVKTRVITVINNSS